jgi:UTP:GlnB (protein PII) uridylyltransferase
LGFQDEPRLIAVDGLMRAVFEHARVVDALTSDVIVRGRAPEEAGSQPVQTLEDALRLVADAAGAERSLTAAETAAIEEVRPSDATEWTDNVRDAFLQILQAGARAAAGLEMLDRLDLLVPLIPGWADVRCRPQRDPYHRYTVDVHLLRALDRMSVALSVPDASDPMEVAAASEISEREGALLGALLHDIGKIGEGGHVSVGCGCRGPPSSSPGSWSAPTSCFPTPRPAGTSRMTT